MVIVLNYVVSSWLCVRHRQKVTSRAAPGAAAAALMAIIAAAAVPVQNDVTTIMLR
jgi:hypothetical protein